jgi:hypothetical protein
MNIRAEHNVGFFPGFSPDSTLHSSSDRVQSSSSIYMGMNVKSEYGSAVVMVVLWLSLQGVLLPLGTVES